VFVAIFFLLILLDGVCKLLPKIIISKHYWPSSIKPNVCTRLLIHFFGSVSRAGVWLVLGGEDSGFVAGYVLLGRFTRTDLGTCEGFIDYHTLGFEPDIVQFLVLCFSCV